MLNSQGFDLWADGYDQAVGLCEEENSYPFAGYKQVLGTIYRAIRQSQGAGRVLDLGFGTGTLTQKLYEDGYEITGLDFSPRMIALAQQKMPGARLICHDFSSGLPEGIGSFDAIVSTYALHHLTDEQKPLLLNTLLSHLNAGGTLYIGDVAFETRAELERCQKQCGGDWDEEEFYFVREETEEALGRTVGFERCSFCAGVLTIR